MTTTYFYNNANRLASFTKGSVTTGTYTYNARGQLVIRNVTNSSNHGITVYFYDQQGHVIAEYNGVSFCCLSVPFPDNRFPRIGGTLAVT